MLMRENTKPFAYDDTINSQTLTNDWQNVCSAKAVVVFKDEKYKEIGKMDDRQATK